MRNHNLALLTAGLIVSAVAVTGCSAATSPDNTNVPSPPSSSAEENSWGTLEEAALSWHTLTSKGQYAEACKHLSVKAKTQASAAGGDCETSLPGYISRNNLDEPTFNENTTVRFVSWSETDQELQEQYTEFNNGNGYYLLAVGSQEGTKIPLEERLRIGYSNNSQVNSAAFFGWDEEQGVWVITSLNR